MTNRRRATGPDAGERAFLSSYDPHQFPAVAVTVDVAILSVRVDQLCALLVRRGGHPYLGQWALPGGFVRPDEDLDRAAARELREEAGLADAHLEQLRCYGAPRRDPRMRVISVAYLALIAEVTELTAGTDATEARYWPLAEIAGSRTRLAFDHHEILHDAVERVRAKLEYTSLATTLLPEPFTISDLRRIYETVWGVELHAANFRRKVLATPGFVEPTGERAPTGRGWTELYARGGAAHLHPALLRPPPR